MSVMAVVTISSPGSGSIAATARCTAAVPDAHAIAWRTPRISAKRASSAGTCGPLVLVSVPLSRTWERSASSSSPKVRPLASWSDGRTSGGCTTRRSVTSFPPRAGIGGSGGDAAHSSFVNTPPRTAGEQPLPGHSELIGRHVGSHESQSQVVTLRTRLVLRATMGAGLHRGNRYRYPFPGAPRVGSTRSSRPGDGRSKRRSVTSHHIAVVYGTRPEIVKLAGVLRGPAPRARPIHTGQHYSPALSDVFLAQLRLDPPAVQLEIGGTSRGRQIGDATGRLGESVCRARA